MPTPKQHAKSALRDLRALITTLQDARAEGVQITFVEQGDVPNAEAMYILSRANSLVEVTAAEIGIQGTVVTTVEVRADEPPEAV